MSSPHLCRARLSAFADYTGILANTLKFRRLRGLLPFRADAELGQASYGPTEFLSWAIMDHLVERHCIVLRAAAAAVRCSGIADRFLHDLGRGEPVADMHLLVWSESDDAIDERWVAVANATEVAALRHFQTAPMLTCIRRVGDEGYREERIPNGPTGSIAVRVLPLWRSAIERARMKGIALSHGRVELLTPPPSRQRRKAGAA